MKYRITVPEGDIEIEADDADVSKEGVLSLRRLNKGQTYNELVAAFPSGQWLRFERIDS